ncbi:hypothetical protein QJS66_05710 [Kocuria rhizophila]|nr:hypothetical protein QJS66_05710 [Kocuria rhizophila]
MDRPRRSGQRQSLSAGARPWPKGGSGRAPPPLPDGSSAAARWMARLALEPEPPLIPLPRRHENTQPLGSPFSGPRRAWITTIFGEPMDFSHLRGQQGHDATLPASDGRDHGRHPSGCRARRSRTSTPPSTSAGWRREDLRIAGAGQGGGPGHQGQGPFVTGAVSQQAGHLNDT